MCFVWGKMINHGLMMVIFFPYLMFSFDLWVHMYSDLKASHSLSAMINSLFSVLNRYNFAYIIYDVVQDYMAGFYEVKFTLPNYRV